MVGMALPQLRLVAAQRLHQARRLGEVTYLLLPERLGARAVLLGQPLDVVAVAPGRMPWRLAGIALQHFAQQLRVAPAVHQDVVAGVDQVMVIDVGTDHRQAQQRRILQVEAALQGLFEAGHETGAQHIVTVQCDLPGVPETFHVQPLHIHPQLVDVVACALFVQ
uniref:Secreted protein n=1 Tax=Steinernema glaseri TaxID=37863 RepID=A0A1I7YD26_9BILA